MLRPSVLPVGVIRSDSARGVERSGDGKDVGCVGVFGTEDVSYGSLFSLRLCVRLFVCVYLCLLNARYFIFYEARLDKRILNDRLRNVEYDLCCERR